MFALPLQGVPRREGNSVFVDETFQPYEDQWSYLAGIEKLSIDRVQNLIYEMTKEGSLLSTGVWNETDERDLPLTKTGTSKHSALKSVRRYRPPLDRFHGRRQRNSDSPAYCGCSGC